MNDRDALLAGIRDAPDDDAPRLVYADWLDENSFPERAEFIRVQCELARLPKLPDDEGHLTDVCNDERCPFCSAIALRRRERELLDANGERWIPDSLERTSCRFNTVDTVALHRGIEPAYLTLTFARGFVSEVWITTADWLQHADAITAAHPVREVRLTTWPGATWEPLGGNMVKSVLTGNETDELPLLGWDRRDGINRLLAHRWPGITFHLPEQG